MAEANMMASSPIRRGLGATVQPLLHRRRSWMSGVMPAASPPAAEKKPTHPQLLCWPGSEGWLVLDNNGSFKGWFDWLPVHLRVGPWHTSAFVFLSAFYASLVYLKPPLVYPASAVPAYTLWWWADVGCFCWCGLASAMCWSRYGGVWPYIISYTGWSWVLLMARAGCTAFGTLLGPSTSWLGTALAAVGSSLHCVAVVQAVVTFCLWNFCIFPLLLVVVPATPKSTTQEASLFRSRPDFLRFNFSFLLVNLHMLNLPFAGLNVAYGGGARPLAAPDLWLVFVVLALYSVVYLGILDRGGMHFYPMFTPRSPICVVGYSILFACYFGIYRAVNSLFEPPALHFAQALANATAKATTNSMEEELGLAAGIAADLLPVSN